jgi:hypothetical protein
MAMPRFFMSIVMLIAAPSNNRKWRSQDSVAVEKINKNDETTISEAEKAWQLC